MGAECNGFAYSYMSGGFARLGIADRAYEQLRANALDCDRLNLFTSSGYPEKHDPGTVPIDGNGGFCSTVMDMLLYSLPGKLKVLGAPSKNGQMAMLMVCSLATGSRSICNGI